MVALGVAPSRAGPAAPGGTGFFGMSQLEWATALSVARVSSGGPNWSALNGELLLRSSPAAESSETMRPRVVSLTAQRAERFGQQDGQLGAATAFPIHRHGTVEVELSGSPSNRFLPIWTADVGLSQVLGGGWVATGRLRHREYRESIVEGAALSLEKYAGIFRTQYELSSSEVRGAGATTAHHLAADCYYGLDPRDRVRLSFAFGMEAEGVATSGVVTTSVRDGSLLWQQRLPGRWTIESGVSWSDHRSLYTRTEILIGLRCSL